MLLGKVLANADTLQTSACHCEERSDVAIRISAEILGKRVLLRANSRRFSYSPKVVLCVLRCRKENGLPQVCALVRNDMLKTDTCQRR